MAPEQVRGAALTPAIDVFALGALAFYAATSELPFGGADPAVLYRILEQEPDLALCPQPLRPLVSRCLDKDPQRRPTPSDVLELCRPSSIGTGLPMDEDWLPYSLAVEARQFAESRMPAVPPQSSGRRWRAALLAAGAAIVGAVVMLAAVWSGVIGFPGSNSRDAANTTTNTITDTARNTATNTGANYIGQYDVYLSGGYGILLDDPNTQVRDSATPAPDLWFTTANALFYNRNADRAVVLSSNQTPDYQSCATDTHYVANWYFPRFEGGDYFCVISSGRVGLLKVEKVPGPNGTNQYYQFSLTLWRLAGR
jgi:serine/threonine protein kinase